MEPIAINKETLSDAASVCSHLAAVLEKQLHNKSKLTPKEILRSHKQRNSLLSASSLLTDTATNLNKALETSKEQPCTSTT